MLGLFERQGFEPCDSEPEMQGSKPCRSKEPGILGELPLMYEGIRKLDEVKTKLIVKGFINKRRELIQRGKFYEMFEVSLRKR